MFDIANLQGITYRGVYAKYDTTNRLNVEDEALGVTEKMLIQVTIGIWENEALGSFSVGKIGKQWRILYVIFPDVAPE